MNESAERHNHPVGFVVACNKQGFVVQNLQPRLQNPDLFRERESVSLRTAFRSASNVEVDSLFLLVQRDGFALDWPVYVLYDGIPTCLYAHVLELGAGMMAVGAPTRLEATHLLLDVLQGTRDERGMVVRSILRDRIPLLEEQGADASVPMVEQLGALYEEVRTLRKTSKAQQSELDRLRAQKSHFVGMAAHELRNPLCSIRFYSDYMTSHGQHLTEEKQESYLRIIHESSGFMARLIEDMLSASRIESGRLDLDLEHSDLCALVAHTVDLHRPLAEAKAIQLDLDLPSEGVLVEMDSVKVEQVVSNLLTNAIKYSPNGAPVMIRILKEPAHVHLMVQDNGPGIPRDEQENLFEPFRTTSVKSTAGERSTGLGLFISRQIVQGHQGRIWCRSRLGEGSTFHVRFPLKHLISASSDGESSRKPTPPPVLSDRDQDEGPGIPV